MSELIDRQAAIDRINKQREHLKPNIDERDAVGDAAYRVCAEFIERLPSAQRWIPVSERLPEEDKDVLVTVYFKGLVQKHKTGWNDHIKPKSYVEVASQIDGEWHSYSDEYKVARDRHVVTAWMPLPDPYKEEE